MAQIEVSPTELSANRFVLKYNCVKDEFSRPYDAESADKGIPNWESLTTKEGGMCRRIEPDWRAFITSDGPGTLRVAINHPNAKVKSAEVRMTGWVCF